MHAFIAVLFSFVHSSFKSTQIMQYSAFMHVKLLYIFEKYVKGGTNIRQFANAGKNNKKSPIRWSCVANTCTEVDVTSANVSITDDVATSNVIDTTVKDGEMPFPSTAPVCETKLADTIEKIQENSRDEAEKKE